MKRLALPLILLLVLSVLAYGTQIEVWLVVPYRRDGGDSL